MKNNFAQEYAREEEIRAAYNTAKENGNEAGIEKAKADMRSLNEEIGAKGDAYAFVYRLALPGDEGIRERAHRPA